MEKNDFLKCCRAVENGTEVDLTNVVDHKTGRVLYCTTNRFHVDVDGEKDSWLPQVCESTTKG
jgi:hypothetical protein